MTGFKVKKISTPYLLLIPGMAFLFTFFLLPIFNLAQTSTQTPTGETGEYQQSLRFANYSMHFWKIANNLAALFSMQRLQQSLR
jgi:ABC-type sugar transport system permease subunit